MDTTPPTVTSFDPGQRRDGPADRHHADRRVLRGDRPGDPHHDDLQRHRPDDRDRGAGHGRLRRGEPPGDLHAVRGARVQPDLPGPSPSAARPASPTPPASASPSDVTWTFTTAAAPDTTPPTVTGFTPANGATGQSTGDRADRHVLARRSTPPRSPTTTVQPDRPDDRGGGRRHRLYDATNRRATFTPSAALAPAGPTRPASSAAPPGVADARRQPPRRGRDLDVHDGRRPRTPRRRP